MKFAEPEPSGLVRIRVGSALASFPLAAMAAVIELFPEDTDLVGVINDVCTASRYVVLRSSFFPPVSDGHLIPELELIFTKHWDEKARRERYEVKFAAGSFEDGLNAAIREMELAQYKRQP